MGRGVCNRHGCLQHHALSLFRVWIFEKSLLRDRQPTTQ